MQKLAIFPIPYPNIRGRFFAGTVGQVGSSVTVSRADDCVAVNRSSAMFMKPTSGDFHRFVTAITADALTLFVNLDRPNPSSGNYANKDRKILI